MLRWNPRLFRVALALGTIASLAIASGAGARW
jgi:hypothetical protein